MHKFNDGRILIDFSPNVRPKLLVGDVRSKLLVGDVRSKLLHVVGDMPHIFALQSQPVSRKYASIGSCLPSSTY